MGSIGTTLPTSSTEAASGANSQNSTNNLGNESTFLNLLVAQLQNQDPTNPVDGTTFVTQLAEFNNVEQSLAIRQDMDAVSDKYLGTTTPPSDQTSDSTSGTGSTGSTTGS